MDIVCRSDKKINREIQGELPWDTLYDSLHLNIYFGIKQEGFYHLLIDSTIILP